jgi:N-methylhydantoinase A
VEFRETGDGALKGHRSVYWEELGRRVETPVYDHYGLETTVEIKGPAIVEQTESTVVVGPRATAHVDAQSSLVMLIQ